MSAKKIHEYSLFDKLGKAIAQAISLNTKRKKKLSVVKYGSNGHGFLILTLRDARRETITVSLELQKLMQWQR